MDGSRLPGEWVVGTAREAGETVGAKETERGKLGHMQSNGIKFSFFFPS